MTTDFLAVLARLGEETKGHTRSSLLNDLLFSSLFLTSY